MEELESVATDKDRFVAVQKAKAVYESFFPKWIDYQLTRYITDKSKLDVA